ncbi:MAG: hypothetical protein V4736_07075 [Bdellovibrionota bacterium]
MKRLLFFVLFLPSFNSIAKVKNGLKESTPSDVVIPVTKTDVKILQKASKILSSESKWNRDDNRECPMEAKSFSLYCAMNKASIEVNGEFDHRLPAMEELRRSVEDFTKNKKYEHRLMGFNNDPSTTFADIKRILLLTEDRLSLRLRATTN